MANGMEKLTRRGFFVSAAAAGAAFGLDGPLEFIAPAYAQKKGAPDAAALMEKGFARFKIGDIEVTQIYDGTWQKAHDANFIKGVSVDATKDELKAAGLPDGYVPIPFTVTVVKRRGKVTMFDSGTGGQLAPTAGLIVKKEMLKAAGITRIDSIVVTHFHPDHILGLMAKDTNAQVFPNVEIVVPEGEYKFWTDPALPGKVPEAMKGLVNRMQSTFPTWKNIRQVADNKDAVPGVRSINTNGHTPGHTSYLVSSGRRQLIVLGDVTNIPALFVRHPDWHAAFDADPAKAEANRRKMFDRVVADEVTVTGYHYGMPGAGTIRKDGKGYAFVPVSVKA